MRFADVDIDENAEAVRFRREMEAAFPSPGSAAEPAATERHA